MKEAGDTAECGNLWNWDQNEVERFTFPSHDELTAHLNSLPALQVKGEDEDCQGRLLPASGALSPENWRREHLDIVGVWSQVHESHGQGPLQVKVHLPYRTQDVTSRSGLLA